MTTTLTTRFTAFVLSAAVVLMSWQATVTMPAAGLTAFQTVAVA